MILVVGATGTVGRKVIDALLTDLQVPVRAFARGKSDWEGSLLPGFRRRGIEVVVGDIRSESTVERAVKDCNAIINCAGSLRAYPDADLESVNVDGVKNLVRLGQAAGVQRFIQLSCLGATAHSTNPYFAFKWSAEEAVRQSNFYWTVCRPSLIFDTNSSLFRILDFWVQRSPLIFVVGSGLNRFQPVSAADVAACLVQSLYDRDTVGKTFDICGPETIDLQSLLALIAESRGRPTRMLRIPSFLGIPLSGLLGKLNPNCPIDNNVMKVMTSEMTSNDSTLLEKFALQPVAINTSLPTTNKIENQSTESPASK